MAFGPAFAIGQAKYPVSPETWRKWPYRHQAEFLEHMNQIGLAEEICNEGLTKDSSDYSRMRSFFLHLGTPAMFA